MAYEFRIFHDRGSRLVHAVPVRDLVAQAGAHARFLRRFLNLKKGASDRTETCVMVKNRRHAAFDTVYISSHRA